LMATEFRTNASSCVIRLLRGREGRRPGALDNSWFWWDCATGVLSLRSTAWRCGFYRHGDRRMAGVWLVRAAVLVEWGGGGVRERESPPGGSEIANLLRRPMPPPPRPRTDGRVSKFSASNTRHPTLHARDHPSHAPTVVNFKVVKNTYRCLARIARWQFVNLFNRRDGATNNEGSQPTANRGIGPRARQGGEGAKGGEERILFSGESDGAESDGGSID